MFSHFRIFQGTQLILCMFLSFPGFSRCSRCFLLRTSCLTVVPLHVPVISGYFRFGPTISQLFPLMVLSWLRSPQPPVFFNFPFSSLRASHLEIDPFHVPIMSGAFRFGPAILHLFCFMVLSFPDFAMFSASAVSQLDKSPSCPCHFQIFRTFPTFSAHPSQNCFVSHSCHFRILQILSRLVLPSQNCSPSCSSYFRIFADFSDLFRCVPPWQNCWNSRC